MDGLYAGSTNSIPKQAIPVPLHLGLSMAVEEMTFEILLPFKSLLTFSHKKQQDVDRIFQPFTEEFSPY